MFVCNRLREISVITEILALRGVKISYRYVPTAENVADIVSRGVSFRKFKENLELWLHGPTWLRLPDTEWPSGHLGCIPVENISQGHVVTAIESPFSQFFHRFKSFKLLIGVMVRLYSVGARKGMILMSRYLKDITER